MANVSWPAFVFLGICLLARSLAQCLSFDSASSISLQAAIEHLPSAFGASFVAPFILVLGVLIYEACGHSRSVRIRAGVFYGFSAASLVASFGSPAGNPMSRDLLASLTTSFAGPPQIMLAILAVLLLSTWARVIVPQFPRSSFSGCSSLSSIAIPSAFRRWCRRVQMCSLFSQSGPWCMGSRDAEARRSWPVACSPSLPAPSPGGSRSPDCLNHRFWCMDSSSFCWSPDWDLRIANPGSGDHWRQFSSFWRNSRSP